MNENVVLKFLKEQTYLLESFLLGHIFLKYSWTYILKISRVMVLTEPEVGQELTNIQRPDGSFIIIIDCFDRLLVRWKRLNINCFWNA